MENTKYIIFISCMFFSVDSWSDTPASIFEPFDGEGTFVELPTLIGAIAVGTPVVVAAYAVCVPTAWVYDKVYDTKSFDTCMAVPSRAAAVTGAILIGGPFYILKKIFWDFPRWLFGVSNTTTQKLAVNGNMEDDDLFI